jgi:AraC-like DNA-binding protein
MAFVFDFRLSDAPFVETVWRTQTEGTGPSFVSTAASQWEMVITKEAGRVTFTVRGPETKASLADIPQDAEIFGISFKLGTFMPHLPATQLVDGGIHLPATAGRSFYLHGSAWSLPDFDNADTFIARLIRQGLLAYEPIVPAALQGQFTDLSPRSVQRRFLRATGLTHGTVSQIQRAHQAMKLLQQGVPIGDTVDLAGYADQPHLTRSLKRFIGRTPAQLIKP